jgi:site-specific recombinase XerD
MEGKADKLRQTVRWLQSFLQRTPTVADLDIKNVLPFYRFLVSQRFVPATIAQHRSALQTIWRFAAAGGLAPPCPTLPLAPKDLKPKVQPLVPGTLEHFFEHSFVPSNGRPLTHTRRRRFRYALSLWKLFHGRPAQIDDIGPSNLNDFHAFVAAQPRHAYTKADAWVKYIRELLHAARPEKWPKLRRKNAKANRSEPVQGTIREFFETVYRPMRLVGASKVTILDYQSRLNVFEDFTGPGFAVSKIDDTILSAFCQDRLGKGVKADTVNGYLRVLFAVIAFARRKKLTDYEPCVSALKTKKREPECWTLEEMKRILEAASNMPGMVGTVPAGQWWKALILFVYNCGTRISATMAVPSNLLNLETGYVLVPAEVQKQRADQRFDLLPETIRALKAIDPFRNECIFDDWPFDRTQPQFKALNNGLKCILRQAGLPCTRFDMWHKIRRTFATMTTIHAGKAFASEMLGHSCMRITEAYLDKRLLDRPSIREALPSITAR